MNPPAPRGFSSIVARIGLRSDSSDFSVIASDVPAVSSAVFTRSTFAGPSVVLSRQVAATGSGRAIVTIAQNANVATGETGAADAREVQASVAGTLGVDPSLVFISSTGVIGRPYPMDLVRARLDDLPAASQPADLAAVARAIMTTDTHPKIASRPVGDAVITGIAKGVGMIEPDMATLLTYFVTDADVAPHDLDAAFRAVVDRTFNAVSVDGDTSTSDSAVILANGLAGPVDLGRFTEALHEVALDLVKMVASDGEGASKLLQVDVVDAASTDEARIIAKSVVNSPLVKTAVHGADPNWGRLAMAVGKTYDSVSLDPEAVRFFFGEVEMSRDSGEQELERARAELTGDEVTLRISLGRGDASFTAYGCDLTYGYIDINAGYTT